MKVFCPEHRRGFFAPRQSPIRCENRGHLLGKFDFEGEAKPPYELNWQYCCNCEHFCPIDFEHDRLERCPVCTRRTSALYLCNRCYTVSFESNTPLQTKNFTITPEGVPQPSCPGCLQMASADVHEHTCDEISVSFITALASCPICGERLDVGPSFPSSVSAYLKRTKAAHKLNVTFDYETELFVPVGDGEFVLVSAGEDSRPIVLPRSPRLSNRRDFYEFYQDYYHCARPVVGELHVLEPAFVDAVENGWKLQAPGTLEVVEDQPKKKAQVGVTPLRLDEEKEEEPQIKVPAIATPVKRDQIPATAEPAAPCPHCGSLIEAKYSFCWKCGKPLAQDTKPVIRAKENGTTPQVDILLDPDDEELTVQHEERAPGLVPFSWAIADTPSARPRVIGSVLKLIAVALVGVLLSLVFFLLTRATSSAASSTTTQPIAGTTLPDTKPLGTAPLVHDVVAKPEPEPQPTSTQPEDELKKLRERRLDAKASDRTEVLKTFVRAEKAYPDDYRFPYERAKLAIKAGSDRNSHDEAFAALSLAAGKAIKTGKAPEMLESLRKDSSGDFQKLSHGHREWIQLQEALKSKDPKVLNVKMGL